MIDVVPEVEVLHPPVLPGDVEPHDDAEHEVDGVHLVEVEDVHAQVNGQRVTHSDTLPSVLGRKIVLIITCNQILLERQQGGKFDDTLQKYM